jgi:integrase
MMLDTCASTAPPVNDRHLRLMAKGVVGGLIVLVSAGSRPTWRVRRALAFTTRYGTPIEPRNFNRFWDSRCGAAGVRRIAVHDARRTCGSLLADLDVHPRVAMQILRHAQFAITMEIYAQVSSAATRDALKRLGERLDGR